MQNFKPMNSTEFTALINIIVASNSNQQQAIQSALLQAAYATFATDYRTAGENGEPNYDAPHFNAIMDMMENGRGIDVDAIARWINTFAPVQFDKATGCFSINKQKVDVVALYLVSEELRANTFWAWATTARMKAHVHGASDEALYAPVLNWFELDGGTKARAEAAFSSDNVENRIASLIKACIKGGMDDAAELLSRVKNEVVAAAKIAELKHEGAAA